MVRSSANSALKIPLEVDVQPPAYDHSDHPLLLAESTTTRTEVVTTTTTTHVFSLSGSDNPNLHYPVHRTRHREHTNSPSTAVDASRIEKDLPPLPPSDVVSLESAGGRLKRPHEKTPKSSYERPSSSKASFSSDPHLADQRNDPPSTALARAALGLGLPHVFPQNPASHSAEINTVAFKTLDHQQSEYHSEPPLVHRARGYQKTASNAIPDGSSADERRRNRGLSLGATTLFSFGSDRTKEKGSQPLKNPSSAPRSLTRRASFWSWKKNNRIPPPTTSQRPVTSYINSLPLPPPVSPLAFDASFARAQEVTGKPLMHSRGLSRSCSERIVLGLLDLHGQGSDSCRVQTPYRRRSMHAQPSSDSLNDSSLASSSSAERPKLSAAPSSNIRPRAHTSPSARPSNNSSIGKSSTLPTPSSTSLSIPISHTGHSSFTHFSTTEESPELFLARLRTTVSKAEVASILASSTTPMHIEALKAYLRRFDFAEDPLDIALRKLLMEVGLPRETQQIDRVIEAFAGRYLQCNPTLFTSEDQPYILAFSLIMLHTDAFNKSNKRKMSKVDYIKNTRLPGVSPEVLDCFYDNIVHAPFIFFEDPLDVNGQRGLMTESLAGKPSSPLTTSTGNAAALILRNHKPDPYHLIINGQLDTLRINVERFIRSENPYSYEGTTGSWDEAQLQRAFAKANEIEIGSTRPPSFFGVSVGPLNAINHVPIPDRNEGAWTLKVTKIGTLLRKDEILLGGKRPINRKWKTWTTILTGSQLLFFHDSTWAGSFLPGKDPSDGHTMPPQLFAFKPDELLSVKDAIAVYDWSYTKHQNAFKLALPNGRQLLLRAPGEQELNEWISRINYASAFSTAGVRMRPLEMSNADVKLTGVAAATSHLHDIQKANHPTRTDTWDASAAHDLLNMLTGNTVLKPSNYPKRGMTIVNDLNSTDLDVPHLHDADASDQFRRTFEQVKRDLASSSSLLSNGESPSPTPPSVHDELECASQSKGGSLPLPPRSRILRGKIHDLSSKITTVQSQIDADLRLARNIATLTPFQKATRDRLVLAMQNVGKRLMQVRLEYTKLVCYRDVLSKDLKSEARSLHRVKSIALQAATETLQNHPSEEFSSLPFFSSEMLSKPSADDTNQYLDTPSSHRPESSICESFYSALDFGPDWPSSENLFAEEGRQLANSPKQEPDLLSESDFELEGAQNDMVSDTADEDATGHERFFTAPDQPDVRHTHGKRSQRVSLVRVPSHIDMSMHFQTISSQSQTLRDGT